MMDHHSSNKDLREAQKKIVKQFERRSAGTEMTPDSEHRRQDLIRNLGDTGEYPKGRLGPNDEGALRFVIGAENGKVIMDFGKAVRSIGLDPENADEISQSLLKMAIEARRQLL